MSTSTPTSIILPTQSTVFTPPPDCSTSIYMPTTFEWSIGIEGLLVDEVRENTDKRQVGAMKRSCHPEGWVDIAYAETLYWQVSTKSPSDAVYVYNTGALFSILPYPGAECRSGWTSACATSHAMASAVDMMTMCCPSGFACATGDYRCERRVQDGDQVWVGDPVGQYGVKFIEPLSLSLVNYSIVAPAMMIDGRAVSTSLPVETGSEGDENGPTSTSQEGNGNENTGGGSPGALSAGQIGGAAVGGALLLLVLMAIGTFTVTRRRTAKLEKNGREDTESAADLGTDGKQQLPSGNERVELAWYGELGGNPVAELEGRVPVELDSRPQEIVGVPVSELCGNATAQVANGALRSEDRKG